MDGRAPQTSSVDVYVDPASGHEDIMRIGRCRNPMSFTSSLKFECLDVVLQGEFR
jgi:hypothetical protein